MKKKNSKRIVKNLLAFAILALLVYLVDIQELIATFKNVTIEAILYLALLSVALIYVSSIKWQLFLEALGSRVSALHLFNLYLVGYFINLLVPSYLGGDAVRSWYAGKKVGQHEAAAATILERYTGFVAMISLALIFMWGVSGVTPQIKLVVLAIALGIGFISWVAVNQKALNWVEKLPHIGKSAPHLHKVQQGFKFAAKDRGLIFKTLGLSFLFHVLTVVNTMAAAYAIGWYNPPVADLFVVVPLILLIGAVPISPSGLGIQEGAFMFFLSGIGATPAEALAVGVILRAKSYVLALIGGVIWLKIKKAHKIELSSQPVPDGETLH